MKKRHTKTVLVVEDEKSLLRILNDALSNAGLTVISAPNGKEGLEIAYGKHPDIILLDILMPIMNGIQMLKILREDKWGKHVPVILLTNDSNPDHIREVLKGNAVDYLIKSDWEIDSVVNRVKSTLGT